MKLIKRNIRINPFRRRRSGDTYFKRGRSTSSSSSSSVDQIVDDSDSDNTSDCEELQLSALPSMVSKFIVESAEKAYNNMESGSERLDFAESLDFALSSVREGKVIPQQRNSVVDLLAKTTRATLDSIDSEEEQALFLRGISYKLKYDTTTL
mmetsp:Transcript_27967/g.61616  ORF Transcript_27967/g.61616 Transcript_27967/m.61616 type:complete len:152 (-) Transcript_27967:104-559(-)|eukprot:CAMPEP_0168235090 /NCGR_PEP_ID=MMETSP0140_2-20121125/18641_1 /TAXON_ID=44445 /ORGANISM="Pseudo-nitzschia australis, Strain 10249 10 AB" /LENGTH=151 /DNA_ID=CAMNT_0008167981 /DNA_START=83 /DNA_END=538 /DNA_ORIENTATION=-